MTKNMYKSKLTLDWSECAAGEDLSSLVLCLSPSSLILEANRRQIVSKEPSIYF